MKGLFVIAFEGFSILVESPFLGRRIRWLVLVTVVSSAFAFVFALVIPVATSVATPVVASWLVLETSTWTLVTVITVLSSWTVPEALAWAFVAIVVISPWSAPETPAWTFVPLVVLVLWLAVTVHFLFLWQIAVK